jgi:hypothetical protein
VERDTNSGTAPTERPTAHPVEVPTTHVVRTTPHRGIMHGCMCMPTQTLLLLVPLFVFRVGGVLLCLGRKLAKGGIARLLRCDPHEDKAMMI